MYGVCSTDRRSGGRAVRYAGRVVVAEGDRRPVGLDESAGSGLHAASDALADGGESRAGDLAHDDRLRADHCCARLVATGARHAAIAAEPGRYVDCTIHDAIAYGAGVDRVVREGHPAIYQQ